MKIKEETIAPSGKKRIVFLVGLDEIKLIGGLVERATKVFPIGNDWKPDGRRLTNINRAIKDYLKQT